MQNSGFACLVHYDGKKAFSQLCPVGVCKHSETNTLSLAITLPLEFASSCVFNGCKWLVLGASQYKIPVFDSAYMC